jgi:hypothetical protein
MFMKNRTIGLLLGLAFVFALVGCGSGQESSDSNDTETEEVATVNGEGISREDLSDAVENIKYTYAQQGIDVENISEEETVQLEKQAVEQLISNELLQQAAENADYSASTEEIESNIQGIKSQFGSDEEFNKALESNQLTLDELEKQIANEMKINKYIEDNIKEVAVKEAEIKELYDRYSKQGEEELPEFDEIKGELEARIAQEKKNEEIGKLIEKLRKDNEVEVLI